MAKYDMIARPFHVEATWAVSSSLVDSLVRWTSSATVTMAITNISRLFLRWSRRIVTDRSLATVCGVPDISLLDEPLHIAIDGLQPNLPVTIKLNMTNGLNLDFESSPTTFPVGSNGRIDLDETKPVSKDVEGLYVDSMGMFRDLQPCPGSDTRFWSSDVTKPVECTLTATQNSATVVNKSFQRVHMGAGITRREVTENGLRGTLFLPPEGFTRPPIITCHGGIVKKKIVEGTAAVMASRGFPALSLGYFGVEGLPRKWFEQPMDFLYFEKAMDFLAKETNKETGVGIWGISKGGEIALACSAFFPERIKATVAINVFPKVLIAPWQYDGQPIKSFPGPVPISPQPHKIAEGLYTMEGWDQPLLDRDDLLLPFWRMKAPVLWIAGEDDRCCCPAAGAKSGAKVAAAAGKTNVNVITFPVSRSALY